jgi:uncharacterized DUF497 family protein
VVDFQDGVQAEVVTRLEFEWDVQKAKTNLSKHGIGFEQAMLVFDDPLALVRQDDDMRAIQERWITLGRAGPGRALVVIHTHIELTNDLTRIRIISARRATRSEARQYEERAER